MIPSISVVTVALNSEATIGDTLDSVAMQRGVTCEHIVKDAVSSDHTLAIVRSRNPAARIISCKDNGIYHGMNQGFDHCTGDIVAFLNSDDRYSDENVLRDVSVTFAETGCDFAYGDILIVNEKGQTQREWKVGNLPKTGLFRSQIPHPALFIKRSSLTALDERPFDESYRISADLKQQLQLINRSKAIGAYIPRVLAIMTSGGTSTSGFRSYFQGWRESSRAWNEVHGSGGNAFVIQKVFSKITSIRDISILIRAART